MAIILHPVLPIKLSSNFVISPRSECCFTTNLSCHFSPRLPVQDSLVPFAGMVVSERSGPKSFSGKKVLTGWSMSSFGIEKRSYGEADKVNWEIHAVDKDEEASGGDDGGVGGPRHGGGDGSSGDESWDEGSGSSENRKEALAALALAGRTLKSLPEDLAAAVSDGKISEVVMKRFMVLEKSPFRKWLMRFGGFRERLLADDLFLTKVGIESGVGIFTKTAAELERRRENFSKELDFVVADIAMALIGGIMLVWLPAPTVSLRPALAKNVGPISKFFATCPDNAFQMALRGTTYSLAQRLAAIVRNGSKLFVVATSASLLGTAITNGLLALRTAVNPSAGRETEDLPVFQMSLAYGVYTAISSNLRYQVLAGVVEARILEPMLGDRKIALSMSSFTVRTGNTFLGSLLWVDFARWVGVQKRRE